MSVVLMPATAKPQFKDLPDVGAIADGEVVVRDGDSFIGGDAVSGADLAGKQDAATAATDTELQAAVDTINAALALKADTADVPTDVASDAELAAAVATINAAVALKQDTATAATDSELSAHANDGTFVHNVSEVADTADPRFPTTTQKSALAGTSGTPGSANKFVTDGDSRNTNARTPTTHSHPTSEVTGLDAALAAKQPLDSDLTAIAALSTTSTGRGLLAIADAAAGRTILAAAGDSATTTALATKQASSEKGQASGYASLDSGGKVPSAQLAAIAITSTTVVGSQAAQLALTAQEGDIAVRSDEAKTYVQNGGSAGTMADWTFLQTPASAVLSVNGQTGTVSLTYTDVGAASTSDSRLSDTRTPTDGSVTAAKVNAALKPSGSAASGDEALRALGSGSTTAAAGNDSRFPTAGQKNALAGTSGTPGTGNEYVTTQDSRNADSRAPSGSAGGVLGGTYPNPSFAVDMATQAELDAVSATVTSGLTLASREKWSNA